MVHILELVSFETEENINLDKFLEESKHITKEFLEKQKGFVKRTLAKGAENSWVDLVEWETLKDALDTQTEIIISKECESFFEMIKGNSINMVHVEKIKAY